MSDADPVVSAQPKTREETNTRRQPPYHVILENDDVHTFDFVISVLRKVFGFVEERAYQLAFEAHSRGRSIVWTGTKELGELKVEQVRSFSQILDDGRKIGPLGVSLEPAA